MSTLINNDIVYKDWLNLSIHLLWCYDDIIARGIYSDDHPLIFTHYENSGAWYIRKGWAKVVYANGEIIAREGQWMVLKPENRIQSFAKGTELISISFKATWPDGSHLFEHGLPLILEGENHPELENKAKPVIDLANEFAPESWDTRSSLVSFSKYIQIQSLLYAWLLELQKSLAFKGVQHTGQFRVDDRVLEAIRILYSKNLRDKLDINSLAEAVFLSKTHLIRLFHKDLKQSPAQYYENIRIEYAKERLNVPDSRVKETAYALGFNHLSHFSRWFKKLSGMSPRAYKDLRNNSR